jgi:serine/threonine-protein kinase NIM1
VADFGFSVNAAPTAMLESFCGSPPFAAPELFAMLPYTGGKTDTWSLGAVLFFMLTGNTPFDAPSLPLLAEVCVSLVLLDCSLLRCLPTLYFFCPQ